MNDWKLHKVCNALVPKAKASGRVMFIAAAADIQSITRVFGWVTGILIVQYTQGESLFRWFGAKQFAATLAERYGKSPVSGTS